jgi:hypothetical protein
MAPQATKRKSSRRRSGNGRSSSQKPEKYRFAQNVGGEETVAEREYRTYASSDPEEMTADADVLLDVPVVKVDSIHLKVAKLEAHLALKAEVFDLVRLNVGVDIELGKLELDLKGVEAQALVKVRLDHIAAIVDRVMTTVDRNPDLLESVGQALEDVGGGAGDAIGESGEAMDEIGEGAEGGLQGVGQGAGQAVGQLGQGAGQAAGGVGDAVGGLTGQSGQGAGGVGQAVGGLVGGGQQGQAQGGQQGESQGGQQGQAQSPQGGQTQPDAQQQGGQQGEAQQQEGGQQQGGQDEEGGGELEQVLSTAQGAGELSGGQVAKVAAKTVAKEIGSAASDEAKDLGVAATRKIKELGEKRRDRRARKHNATPAAARTAEELDVDLDDVEGSGAEGRITVQDVREVG